MGNAIVVSGMNKKFIDKIICDLKFALRDLSGDELFIIFKYAAVASLKTTYETKKDVILKTSDFIKETIKRYKENGVIQSLKEDVKRANDFVISLPDKTRDIYNNFIVLNKEEQIELIAVTILTVSIFYISAGGLNLEGGLPDTDITLLGIQHHRNYFSHSILIGLGVEFTGRFSIKVLEKIKNRMPYNRHPVWDDVYNFIDKHKNKAIAAMWFGIGIHLLKDSGILGGGVTPYKDLPFSMPIEAHKGLFAANGVASGLFGSALSKK